MSRSASAAGRRATFAEQVEQTRMLASRAAWRRGKLASRVRHLAKAQNRSTAARRAAKIKYRAVERAVHIRPHGFEINNDWEHGSEIVCVHCLSGDGTVSGSLHVPRRQLLAPTPATPTIIMSAVVAA